MNLESSRLLVRVKEMSRERERTTFFEHAGLRRCENDSGRKDTFESGFEMKRHSQMIYKAFRLTRVSSTSRSGAEESF